MKHFTIEKKLLPQNIQRLFGRKRKARVWVADSVTISGTGWSGGTRSQYTGLGVTIPHTAGSPFESGPASAEVELSPGKRVFEGGTFCGKPNAVLWVHPDDEVAAIVHEKGES